MGTIALLMKWVITLLMKWYDNTSYEMGTITLLMKWVR